MISVNVAVIAPTHHKAVGYVFGCEASLKMSCVPTLRQITCGSPGRISSPYCQVARPFGAQVISNTPGAPSTPLTRRPGRNRPSARSDTNWLRNGQLVEDSRSRVVFSPEVT